MEEDGQPVARRLAALLDLPAQIAQAGPGHVVVQHPAEGGAAGSRHAAHAGVVDELAPAGGHQAVGHGGGAHVAQHLGHLADAVSDGAVHLADLKEVVIPGQVLGQLGNAGRDEGGAPQHRAAHGAALPHVAGHIGLGNAVLQGTHRAVRTQVGQQVGQDHVVGGLLGKEEDDVVNALHLLGGDGLDGDGEVHRAHDVGALFVERLHVGLVAVHHLHVAAVLGHVGAQHRTHGAAAQDRNFHEKTSFLCYALSHVQTGCQPWRPLPRDKAEALCYTYPNPIQP